MGINMAIFKAKVESNYVLIPNGAAQDKTLSFEARGVLLLLLSMPEDWAVYKSWLSEQAIKCGKNKLTRILKELEDAGYMQRRMAHGEGGKFASMDWDVYPVPTVDPKNRPTVKPSNGKSATTKETLIQSKQDTKETSSPTAVGGEGKSKTDYCDEFEWIWKNKPARQGSNGKKSAYNACRARIKSGATWRELAEGVVRYAKHCKADGKLGTQYVMQMTTFFGPDEHYKNEWTTTSSTNTNHKSESTLPTAQEVMSKTSTKSLSEAERKKLEQESKTVFSSLWEDA